MRCAWCGDAPPRHVCWDLPDREGEALMGDRPTFTTLCDACLAASLRDGPWHAVEPLPVEVSP